MNIRRLPHLDSYPFHFFPTIAKMEMQHLDARERFQPDHGFRRNAILEKVFADAAAGIPAHLGFRAVGVEDSHLEICDVRGFDKDQTVATDAGMRAAPPYRPFFGMGEGILHGIDIDIVVPGSLHFCKFNPTHNRCFIVPQI